MFCSETKAEGHAVDVSTYEFKIPQKEIKSPDQIATVWEKSKVIYLQMSKYPLDVKVVLFFVCIFCSNPVNKRVSYL